MMTQDDLLAAERALEEDAVEAGRARYRNMLDSRGGENSEPGQMLMRRSIGEVIEGIKEWQRQATDGTPGRSVGLAKFLSQYEPDEVAFISLRQVIRAIHLGDQKLTATAMAVVADLEAVDLEARLKAADKTLYNRYVRVMKSSVSQEFPGKRLGILKSQGEYVGAFSAKAAFAWSPSERLQVGVRLLEIIRERTQIVDWECSRSRSGGKREGHATFFITPTAWAAEWLKHAHAAMELARPLCYPMVVPPVDWVDTEGGGYLSTARGFKRTLIRVPFGNFRGEMAAASLPLVTQAVNTLQRVPFAVNAQVLAVVSLYVEQGSASGLPEYAELFPIAPRLDFMDATPYEEWTDAQRELFKEWKRTVFEAKTHNAKTIAEQRTAQTTIEIARKMVRFPAIYFPAYLDFRGRSYPVPAYLQPQGSDLAKGLLKFAESKPLGPHGMRWLAVHLANTYGGSDKLDKAPFDRRVHWVRQHHDQIIADAEDPHRPHALWTQADDPVQFLAAAFEWRAMAEWAVQHGTVETFESCIPIGLDGSCNGLQHFSAMLRDPVGGRATNLIPAAAPADIYSIVADEVRRRIELDLGADDEEVQRFARFWMQKGITRKWTKRNTMTLPYGVTRQGMRDQLWAEVGQLKDARNFFEGWTLDRGKCVGYLAEHNWDAIGSIVVAARAAMDWLQECARALTAAGIPALWTTPDGLPVFQFYRHSEEVEVQMFGAKLSLILRKHTDKIAGNRQRLGLAPNFVHSIDAAHMRSVVRKLSESGITSMSMVHDSFAVHAGHVEALTGIIREAFVDLHSKPLLQTFFDGIAPSLPEDHKVPPVPASGDLDLQAVLQADYFFA